MTVLAASITTRGGKPLLSRQFLDISKDRVMELLSNFQNLVANPSRQHTFVEDEHVRYVYKPFDDFYIILITNRQSNIIQDMDTLNLFSQTVNAKLKGFSESELLDASFDILGSFDEIISLGYKENLSLSQINTFLSMESHEEKIQEIIERNKEIEVAELRKRRAMEINKKELEKRMGVSLPMEGVLKFHGTSDQNMSNAYNSYYKNASPAAQQAYRYLKQDSILSSESQTPPHTTSPSSTKGTGMKLGGKKGATISELRQTKTTSTAATSPGALLHPEETKPANNGILVCIKETVSAEITRDGTVSTSEFKGVLEVRVNNPEYAAAKIVLEPSLDMKDRSFQFKTHPNIDKNAFSTSKFVTLKDPKKSFPSNDQTLGVLRWRKVGSADDKSVIPLNVSTWVSPGSDNTYEVTVEYELNEDFKQQLDSVSFVLPLYTENAFMKDEPSDSNAVIDRIDEEVGIVVKVDSIKPETSHSFSISVETQDEDSLFPINVVFKNSDVSSTYAQVAVTKICSSADDNVEFPFDVISTLSSDEYVIN